MFRLTAIASFISALTLFNFSAVAAEEDDVSGEFSGDAKVGFIYSKTDETSMSVNSGITLKYKEARWHHTGEFSTYYTKGNEEDDGTNKNKIIYDVKYDITERIFAFGNAKYEHDQFATYREQALLVGGFGANIIDTEHSTLDVGAGPGYRYSKRQAFDDDLPNNSEKEMIANFFIEGQSKITDGLEAGGGVRVDYGSSNTTTTTHVFLKNKLMESLSLMLDAEYIYNSVVATGKTHDEIYSTLSLNYGF
jgi:putative salt-induced outer membrane protein YdiY